MRRFAAILLVGLVLGFGAGVVLADGGVTVKGLRCEYRVDPLAIDVRSPRLSWVLESDARGQAQSAYRVLVSVSEENLAAGKGDLWDSGKVASDRSVLVAYSGEPLTSGMRCHWKVRVWDADGEPSEWSSPALWSMGLLEPGDWKAKWIGYGAEDEKRLEACSWVWFPEGNPVMSAPVGTRYFRKRVELPADSRIRQGRFLLAVDNEFVLFVNGKKAGAREGWDAFYAVDVTEFLRGGANVLAIAARNGARAPNPAGLVGQLIVKFETGESVTVPIDASWKACRSMQAGWRDIGFDDSSWPTAKPLGKVGIQPWGIPAPRQGRLPMLRREFEVVKPIKRAIVAVCGLGFYELRLNGKKVGDHELDPGWTDYRKTCLYATYDVTKQIAQGRNAFGVMLGNGMYNVTGGRYVKFKGTFGRPKLILQMDIESADGSAARVVSDETWKVMESPIAFSCIFGGEDYDARMEQQGWDRAGFDDSGWQATNVVDGPGGQLVSQSAPPIKVIQVFKPVKITEPRTGVHVVDFGQNFSGWPKVKVRGPAGARITMVPGELLDGHGLVNQKRSGSPSFFTYTLKGDGVEEWHPRFTYYGFRYVQVEGATRESADASSAKPVLVDMEGQVVHSSAEIIGRFSCSNALFNRIHEIILWAVRSNMQSVLTDCPHREKLGWLEVSHLMGPSILYNYDVPLFYGKIVRDMSESQLANGLVPDIAPEYVVFNGGFRDSPSWGSASVINPWMVYRWYGDVRILEDHYELMKGYVDYLTSRSRGHIVSYGLGDWCDYGPKGYGPSQNTPLAVTGTGMYYHDITILARTAKLLGKTEDAKQYAELAHAVRDAFNGRFFNADTGQYATGSQASNALPYVVGMVKPDRAGDVVGNIVKDVRRCGNHLTAGDVGMRFLVQALGRGGRSDVVFDMMNQTDLPSYGFQIQQGCTSLAEVWDPRKSSSLNHCMLGHVEEWFYRSVAGIDGAPDSIGFDRIAIAPQVVGNLTWAKGSYRSVRGRISTEWKREGESFTLKVTIPVNATATVNVPARTAGDVTESGVAADKARAVQFLRMEQGAAVYRVGSGRYEFTAR